MNNPPRNSLGWLAIFPLLVALVIFFLIWIMLGKPIYTWDSAWYRNIVDYGYVFDGNITKQQNTAFLPGYPILIKIISLITGFDSVISQQIVCLLGYLVGSWFFFKVFSSRIGEYRAAAVMFIWSFMPFSIYFMNGYSESVLFALAGAFFYLLEKGHIVSACIAISYGLITRPHALALLPVLFYYLFRIEQDISNFSRHHSLYRAGIKSVELAPLIIFFPAMLTLYWFYNFGDSLVYKNILHAWGGISQTPVQKLALIVSIIKGGSQYSQYTGHKIYTLTLITLSPHHAATIVVVAGALLTAALFNKKYFDFFLFNATVMAMLIFSSSVENSGRHSAIMFSIPLVSVIGAHYLITIFRESQNIKDKLCSYPPALLFCFLFLIFMSLSCIHFVWYTIRYFNTVWVS